MISRGRPDRNPIFSIDEELVEVAYIYYRFPTVFLHGTVGSTGRSGVWTDRLGTRDPPTCETEGLARRRKSHSHEPRAPAGEATALSQGIAVLSLCLEHVDVPMADAWQRLQRTYRSRGPIGTGFRILEHLVPHPYDAWVELTYEEWKVDWGPPLSLRDRLWTYRHGFQSHCWYFYGFGDGADPDDYLSEVTRRAYTDRINGEYSAILDDKARFYELFEQRGLLEYLPELYGRVEDGRFEAIDGGVAASRRSVGTDGGRSGSAQLAVETSERSFRDVVGAEGQVVVKPTTGSGGSDVKICRLVEGGVQVNDEERVRGDVESVIADVTEGLVVEYCQQAEYLQEIYPGSPNTLRVLLMHPEDGEPFVARAMQRIGSSKTGGLDSFSKGGLAADVDLETGELATAIRKPPDRTAEWYDEHPDTNAAIAGRTIPGWAEIKDEVLAVSRQLPEFRYVAWDVLVTGPGEFVFLEGNSRSDVDLYQAEAPLLADDRIREFYADHGVPVGR